MLDFIRTKRAPSGGLSRLEGEDKPLPDRSAEAFGDAGDALGFCIMAQAGVVPEEITLKEQTMGRRPKQTQIVDPAARRIAVTELAQLKVRQAIAQDARYAFKKR